LNVVKSFFPGWSAGWVEKTGGKADINLSTYQLLMSDSFDEEFFRQFGHHILDEFHRAGAEEFMKAVWKSTCKYRTCLTATFRRKDNVHTRLKHFCGPVVTIEGNGNVAHVIPVLTGKSLDIIDYQTVGKRSIAKEKVELYKDYAVKHFKTRKVLAKGMLSKLDIDNEKLCITDIKQVDHWFGFQEVTFHKLGSPSVPRMDTDLSLMSDRNEQVKTLAKFMRDQDRNVLVLGKRNDALFDILNDLIAEGVEGVGILTSEKIKRFKDYAKSYGRTPKEQSDWVKENCSIILANDKIAEEGLDIPKLDTLIYMHLLGDPEQSIGRTTRWLPGKKLSVVLCMVDSIHTYRNMFMKKRNGIKAMCIKLGHMVGPEWKFNKSQLTTIYKKWNIQLRDKGKFLPSSKKQESLPEILSSTKKSRMRKLNTNSKPLTDQLLCAGLDQEPNFILNMVLGLHT
jgi:superfamily II DNA or RNA helicase